MNTVKAITTNLVRFMQVKLDQVNDKIIDAIEHEEKKRAERTAARSSKS